MVIDFWHKRNTTDISFCPDLKPQVLMFLRHQFMARSFNSHLTIIIQELPPLFILMLLNLVVMTAEKLLNDTHQ